MLPRNFILLCDGNIFPLQHHCALDRKFSEWKPIGLSLLVSRWCTEEVSLSFGPDPPSLLILVLQRLAQDHLKKKEIVYLYKVNSKVTILITATSGIL